MAISAARATAATTAGGVLLASGINATGPNGTRVNIRNRGALAVYLGGSGVATTTGFQLDPGESVSFLMEDGEDLYGITASSTAVVHVLKGGA